MSRHAFFFLSLFIPFLSGDEQSYFVSNAQFALSIVLYSFFYTVHQEFGLIERIDCIIDTYIFTGKQVNQVEKC